MKPSNLHPQAVLFLPPTSTLKPPASIVITTKNEERNIEHCMKSIKFQSYENREVIVVDNFSTDKTKEIALKYTNKVYDKDPERSAQRNFEMMSIAKGKYVMFVDADMILSPRLVESCVKEMEKDCQSSNLKPPTSNLKPTTIALHIPEIVLGKKYFSKVRRFERSFYDGTVIDCARFFLKEAFVKVGGFDEGMSGPQDWDIDKKIKQNGKIGLLDHVGANCNSPDWELHKPIKTKKVLLNKMSRASKEERMLYLLKSDICEIYDESYAANYFYNNSIIKLSRKIKNLL